jgi:hypothetical protein
MKEPGLDTHEWVSRWESLEPDLADAPSEALPEVGRLIDEMLAERETDPEIERELELAREVTARLDAGETVDPGDVGAAVAGYRAVYAEIVNEID